MNENEVINESQVSVIRTLWELAQGRIDELYSVQGAEEEKKAVEEWMTRAFPNNYDSFIRSI